MPWHSAFSKKFDQAQLGSSQLTVVFASLASLSPLGMDSYLPAVSEFAKSLNVSSEQASLTLSYFLVGLGLGQLVGGAWSDQKGRRVVALSGLCLYLLSSFAIVAFQVLEAALAFRFLQGAAGGLMMVSGMAMLKDTTEPERLAERIALAIFVIMIMPVVAPIIGSTILAFAPWPAIFLMCGGVGTLMFVFIGLKVPETHSRRTGKLSPVAALRQYAYVIGYRIEGWPVPTFQALANALGSGVMLTFVIVAPSLLMEHYGLSSAQFPLAFGAVVIAMLVGNRLGKQLLGRVRKERLYIRGLFVSAFFAALFLALSWLVVLPVWLFILLLMFSVGSYSTIGPAGQAMYLNLLDRYYGSATAFEQTMRFSLGGVLGGIAVSLPLPPVQAAVLMFSSSVALSILCFSGTLFHWRRVLAD